MATPKPLPAPGVPMVDAQGRITTVWFEYFRSREMVGMSDLPDVKLTSLANGDSLTWVAADSKWEN